MRIGIVNDLPLAVAALRQALSTDSEVEIAWVARNGREAVESCRRDLPDVLLMDLVMPGLNGVEATREIMRATPCPILIVTASVTDHATLIFQALGAGAIDAVGTPILAPGKTARGAAALLEKIRRAAHAGREGGTARPPARRAEPAAKPPTDLLVAIGASAGGPAALAAVLESLPAQFPASIIIVQHIDAQFAPLMGDWLNDRSTIPVRMAREGDRPIPGTALVAGTNDHLVLRPGGNLHYTAHPTHTAYRPSVDVFFESAAECWTGKIVGVLLSGMGKDGAKGLKRLRDSGATTIAQDRESSAVYGMPKAAAELDAASRILPLSAIGAELSRICGSGNRTK